VKDTLIVQCGHCGARYRIDRRHEGRRCRCKRCKNIFRLTKKLNMEDSVMDWLEEDEETKEGQSDRSPNAA
jgi:predicted Zn finger-like uncharacterized protein